MKGVGKKRKKQRTIHIILWAVFFAVVAFCIGGFYLWNQARRTNGLSSVRKAGAVSNSQESNTIEYQGSVYSYNDHLSNYLFMGIDTTEEVSSYQSQQDAGQADAVFLVSMDRVTENIEALMIPRDTITEIEIFNPSGKSLGMTQNHINIQYAYGDGKEGSCELMEKAVSSLLGDVPIQGYCSMNMEGIPIMTDLVGGIQVVVPNDTLEDVNPEFQEGAIVTLTGENAEQFVRYRDINISQSAITRQERQKVYMNAFVEKAQKKAEADASFITDLYNEIQPYTVTNMGNDVFAKLLAAVAKGSVDTATVPGEAVEGENFDEYHVNEEELKILILEMFYTKQE